MEKLVKLGMTALTVIGGLWIGDKLFWAAVDLGERHILDPLDSDVDAVEIEKNGKVYKFLLNKEES